MSTEKSIESLQAAELASMAGRHSAISGYLSDAGVPSISPLHKRVKLLSLMYQQAQLEIARLQVLLDANSRD